MNIVKPPKCKSSPAEVHGTMFPQMVTQRMSMDQCVNVCVTYMFSLSGLQGLGRVVVKLSSTKSHPVFGP